MGITIAFEMKLEIGKINNKDIVPINMSFKAEATADGYFGGELRIDSDEKGWFIEPILEFSGIMFTAKIEGEVGWWKSNFEIKETIIPKETLKLDKKYFN